MSKQYYMPVKIITGANCVTENAALFKALGRKAIIVTGRSSAKENGSLQDILTVLSENGQSYVLFDKVMSNPTVACVYEGAKHAKGSGADFVICAGGGSPMDAGKAIAMLACCDVPRDRLFSGATIERALPMAMIPTTAGTGSEVTQYSVLTNDAASTKTSLSSPVLFPKIAFLDGKYMDHLSVKTTVHTAVDALSHLIEGYLSKRADFVSDALAVEGMRMMTAEFGNLTDFTIDRGDREKLLYASCIGGMVIAQTGTTIVHSMGYSLTYFKGVDHGRANGLLLAEYLRFARKSMPERVDALLGVMGLPTIDAFAGLLHDLLSCCELETVTEEEMRHFASIAVKAKNRVNSVASPTEEEIKEIYSRSLTHLK